MSLYEERGVAAPRKVQVWCPDCRFTWPVPDTGAWRAAACPRCGSRFVHNGRSVGTDGKGMPLRRLPTA